MSTAPRHDLLAVVLAGGEGRRLRPLTAECAKPALPVGDRHRLIDFVLSNLFNSGVRAVYVILQFRPESLVAHLGRHWVPRFSRAGGFVRAVLPGLGPAAAYGGTSDAVRRNASLLLKHRPEAVAILAADHVCRMDLKQMLAFHRMRGSELTIAATPVPVDEAGGFGIIGAEADGAVRNFVEKPVRPQPMPGDPTRAYASMGNYLFEPERLRDLLDETCQLGGVDFGHHLVPLAIARRMRVFAYDFSRNRVPGLWPWEVPDYWRDLGTLEAYRTALRELDGPRPKLELDNARWPILGRLPAQSLESRLKHEPRATRAALIEPLDA